ncbi:cilia- and flagella-associated protein 107 [Chanos chanos]|uniref:Cilia- and flagella-associated protein 107 n=1 Tax=Chanos chanos TaxID=29144 RepID=A0A6J2VNN0_CHACN|nr:uncharacterized protein C1orf158 homolog [Chanos chanos]
MIMDNKAKEYNKWSQPGWRIEQKYSNKVLIGNWMEEKLQFTRQSRTANSTHRLDYKPRTEHKPDVIVRREALRKSEGLPARLLLSHHGTPRSHYLVTLYDEMYGRRNSTILPTLRSWNSDKLAWVPEKSDHPVKVPPTNFGLLEAWHAQIQQQQAAVPTLSVYRATYPLHPLSAFCQPRHASAPRMLSGSLRPTYCSSENLKLKSQPCKQVPNNTSSQPQLPSV